MPAHNQKSLTAERLREVLHYDPETGEFCWRINRQGARAGQVAGAAQPNIGIDYVYHGKPRLAFLYQTGAWPKGIMRHLNGDRHDNSWNNLRVVRRVPKDKWKLRRTNTSGAMGVSRHSRRFVAKICVRGTRHYLGCFPTLDAAKEAYIAAAQRYRGVVQNQTEANV